MNACQNIKLSAIIAILNEKVSVMDFKGDHNEFHKRVWAECNDAVNEFGLRLNTWQVEAKNDTYIKVLTYDRDFEKDKRTTDYSPKGKFSNVRFQTIDGFDPEKTVGEYLTHVDMAALRSNIQYFTDRAEQLENELMIIRQNKVDAERELGILEVIAVS